MKTVLICHAGARLDELGLARWMSSFSELAGLVILQEPKSRLWRRIQREFRRSGFLGFLDVLAFRLYYRCVLSRRDRVWEEQELARLQSEFPEPAAPPRLCRAESPNAPEVKAFLNELAPDLMIARCKTLLKPDIFSIPRLGTYVLHPGMCPEYRNAHGCFWALANGQPEKVAVTLLRIDAGVDTGPVYGYFTYPFDARTESHVVIQARAVTENLAAIRAKLEEIAAGVATPLVTHGRPSAVWGQPWLSRYLSWKLSARRAAHASCHPAVS